MKKHTFSHKSGFTLAEVMVGLTCFVVIGGIIYLLLNSGMILYAKNMSVNTAHEDTRRAVNRLLRDIHAAVSVPQLIDGLSSDGTLQVHTSNTTAAAGVSFQLVWQDPNNPNDTGTHYIWKDPSSSVIMIYNNGSCTPNTDPLCPPFAGQRLVVPLWGIEADITKATAGGVAGHVNVWLQDEQGNIVDQTGANGKAPQGQGNNSNKHSSSNDVYAVSYYTERVAYLVQNGQLRLYYHRYTGGSADGTGGTWKWVNPVNNDPNGIVVARDITSPTPFSAEWSNAAGVASIRLTNAGSNYTPSTTVTISGGGGTGATATCTTSGPPTKTITGVTVTNAGSGYTSVPTVSFSGGSGSGATGVVFLTSTPTTDDRYVHVTLTATDPTFNNRGHKATSSLVDSAIPYRSRLCSLQ
ncbi:MAG: type II secretion system protein J [Chthoniobacterales bacterium]